MDSLWLNEWMQIHRDCEHATKEGTISKWYDPRIVPIWNEKKNACQDETFLNFKSFKKLKSSL